MAVEIHVIGSGTPTPATQRYGTAFAIEIGDEIVLVDCGPATTWKLCRAGLEPTRVSKVFITHHHYDHNVDAACLVLTRWNGLINSAKPICICGPEPTSEFCARLFGPSGAHSSDWISRINWDVTQSLFERSGGVGKPHAPVVLAKDIGPGWNDACPTFRVTAGYAEHAQPTLDSLAYRFDFSDGTSAVFTGDTAKCDEIIKLAKGADLLFCMALGGHVSGCSDPETAGAIARLAGVKTLVLTHTSGSQSPEDSLAAAGKSFTGEIRYGEELSSFLL